MITLFSHMHSGGLIVVGYDALHVPHRLEIAPRLVEALYRLAITKMMAIPAPGPVPTSRPKTGVRASLGAMAGSMSWSASLM